MFKSVSLNDPTEEKSNAPQLEATSNPHSGQLYRKDGGQIFRFYLRPSYITFLLQDLIIEVAMVTLSLMLFTVYW